ncbi:MAG TPA: dUTP diphosphatase [Candidatus Nanoarchaeia archaeon]|nr:dUTP diphosphatase [Candidatus Nanoarchaeia archaeon]
MVKLKVRKLVPEAKLPFYKNKGDACMDVYATNKKETEKYVEYTTGLAFELPENYVLLVFPRSSITNRDLIMKNSVGILDSGFRGELKLRFAKQKPEENKKNGKENKEDTYEVGERIGQIMLLPLPEAEIQEVEKLSESTRGEGGFGSTGKY